MYAYRRSHLKGCNIHHNVAAVGSSIQGDGTSRGLDPHIFYFILITQAPYSRVHSKAQLAKNLASGCFPICFCIIWC